jgi:hypothetical protein
MTKPIIDFGLFGGKMVEYPRSNKLVGGPIAACGAIQIHCLAGD